MAEVKQHISAHLHRLESRKASEDSLLHEAYYRPFLEGAYSLYQKLLEPYLPQETQKLIIISDGKLSYIPFESLLLDKPTFKPRRLNYSYLPFLGKKYCIRHGFSASLLFEAEEKRQNNARGFAGFAPSYASDDSYEIPPALSRHTSFMLTGSQSFSPLSHNRQEVKNIGSLIHGDVFEGDKANESKFKSVCKNYQVIHLAMHAWAHDSLAALSGMAFQASNDSIEDGILYLSEIYNLPLQAEIIVLSGCQTGSGRTLQGEGIMSVGRAFKYAGSPNIIYSLWSVDDEATGLLMQAFYRFLNQGMGKAEALQQAKITLMSNPKFAHPYFWSPFVLMGDNHSLEVKKTGSSWFPYLLGAMLLMLIAFLVLRRKGNATQDKF